MRSYRKRKTIRRQHSQKGSGGDKNVRFPSQPVSEIRLMNKKEEQESKQDMWLLIKANLQRYKEPYLYKCINYIMNKYEIWDKEEYELYEEFLTNKERNVLQACLKLHNGEHIDQLEKKRITWFLKGL